MEMGKDSRNLCKMFCSYFIHMILFHTVLCKIVLRQNILVKNGEMLIPIVNKVYSEYLIDCLERVQSEKGKKMKNEYGKKEKWKCIQINININIIELLKNFVCIVQYLYCRILPTKQTPL
jgi:hypothetical protein